MICSRCGTHNFNTSKYCRECGKRLVAEGFELEDGLEVMPKQPVDESAVNDLLYETLRLYEQGRLDVSFAKCKEALKLNPNSASARSLLGLIYEAKADEQAARGNREEAVGYLQAAIRQIERVIETNPDSVADRGKLDSLRAKLHGPITGSPAVGARRVRGRLMTLLNRIPVPVAAGGGTFLLVFLVLLFAFAGGKNDAPKERLQPPVTPAPQGQFQQPGPAYLQQGQPYAQPGQQAQVPPGYPQSVPSAGGYPQQEVYNDDNRESPPQTNQQLPARTPPPLPTSLESLPAPSSGQQRDERTERPERNESVEPVRPPEPQPIKPPAERAREAYSKGDYAGAATLMQEAISRGQDTGENYQFLAMSLYYAGRKSEAISNFERAVQQYMDRMARGIDVESSKRGISTCKNYIELLKE